MTVDNSYGEHFYLMKRSRHLVASQALHKCVAKGHLLVCFVGWPLRDFLQAGVSSK